MAQAARARTSPRGPRRASPYEGNELAVIAHGQVVLLRDGEAAFDEVDALQVATGMESPRGWSGDAVYLRLDAQRLFTYARDPERYGTA